MARWRLQFCGTETLAHCGGGGVALPNVAWPILGCLTAAPRFRASRGRLAAQLWPEQDEEGARHRLATSLWRIRAALDHTIPLIRSDGDTVALDLGRDLWVDAIMLERRLAEAVATRERLTGAVERRRLAHALRWYRGDFLAEHEQEPIMVQRARLRALYLDALHALTCGAARAGAWPEALEHATLLCAAEPLREDAQRLLMEAHARCGNRALALRCYRECAALLARELGVTPMPETRALAAEIEASGADVIEATLPALPIGGGRAALALARRKVVETLALIDRALSA